MEDKKVKIVKCERCGQDFEVKLKCKSKHCDKCKPIVKIERKEQYNATKRMKRAREKEMQNNKNQKPKLSDIERMAREAGMTYGKYCAKMKI